MCSDMAVWASRVNLNMVKLVKKSTLIWYGLWTCEEKGQLGLISKDNNQIGPTVQWSEVVLPRHGKVADYMRDRIGDEV